MNISFEVLHAIPGRIRLKIPEIKDNDTLAGRIAHRLLEKPGITLVRVNLLCASMVISYDTKVIATFLPEKFLRGMKFQEVDGKALVTLSRNGNGNGNLLGRVAPIFQRFAHLILPSAALGLSLMSKIVPIAPMYAIVAAASAPVFQRAASTVRNEKRLGVDFLDATAIGIMGLQRNLPTCAFMAWLISIGEHIREATARKSQKAIADLLRFHSDTAIVIREHRRVSVRVESLVPGDKVVVNAGDLIPIDGQIISGRAGIDQTSLTGESALQERSEGDTVFAGSLNVDGELIIEAAQVGLNTRAGRIVQMLRSTPVQETRIEDYAARFADRLVLPTFAISGLVLAMSGSISRALSMLIVDFGTGVRVAAPTAFLSYMAHAAQKNIVVKGGRAMEKMAAVDTVMFDKTGTLTTGTPEVRDVVPINCRYSAKGIIRLAAAAEGGLNHPVANALAYKAREMKVKLPERIEARLRVGMGVKAKIGDKKILVGSDRLMMKESIDLTHAHEMTDIWQSNIKSPLYVAVNGKVIGVITYADKIRPESKRIIASLKSLGIKNVIMLTGDREPVAREVSEELGIDRFYSEVFPEEKLKIVRKLQKEGRTVAVIGDGINDSLALARADVAIAPSGATDAAKEASDVLLMEDDLRLLVEAFQISKRAVKLVKQNFKIVAVPNAAAIALAAGGLLGPPGATFINNGSTVAAGLNGLRPLLGGKNRKNEKKANGVYSGTLLR